MLSPAITASIVSALLSGIISYLVSRKVAKEQVQTQIQLENQQRLREWYERCIVLVKRTSDDWWEVMTSREKEYDIDAETKFLDRREELREHAARGKGLGADEEVVQDLQRAAGSLGHAVGELDSGKQLATIEKKTLLPTLDSIETACREKEIVYVSD